MDKNEAIKILREAHDKALFSVRTALETLIPELKESEDEMIINQLITLVNSAGEVLLIPTNKDELIFWLEKQKEQKWSPSEGEMRVLYKLCYIGNQITDEDDTDLTRLYQDLKREYFNGHSFENMFSREKQKEQQPALRLVGDGLISDPNAHFELEGVQTPANSEKLKEWSEEDKNKLYQVMEVLLADKTIALRDNPHCKALHRLHRAYDELLDWLKSLRPQPHWKPSEEQMEALKYAIEILGCMKAANTLRELSIDLKKL